MSGLLIVSETRIYRDGLRDSLAANGEFEPVVTARNRGDALPLLTQLPISIVLVDTAGSDTEHLLRSIATLQPEVQVLVLGLQAEREDVLRYAHSGIAGYLLKDGSLDDLHKAIRLVQRGELLCSPSLAGELLDQVCRLSARSADRHRAIDLTAREVELSRLVAEGLSNKEIALALDISVATTKSHVHHILGKLGVSRRADIRRWVVSH